MTADDVALGGTVPHYLRDNGPDLLDRLQPLTDWLDHRYSQGVDPYSKYTSGPIRPLTKASLRKGHSISGINFASQDYLSLSAHPLVVEAAKCAAQEYGVHSAGSAALMGNTVLSRKLEEALASFLGLKDVTLFPTGWAAGYGIVKFLARPTDHIVIDVLAHACLHEGAQNSGARVSIAPHLSADAIERRLRRIRADDPNAGILVVTEALFSMDSDAPDLLTIQDLCRQHRATLVVDCAHDLGAMGPSGRGIAEAQRAVGHLDVVMGSFSKTFASNGGFVATNHPALKLALRYGSGPQTFSNALSPTQCAVVLAALDIVVGPEGDRRRQQLLANSIRLRAGLQDSGFKVLGQASPIVQAILGDNGQSRLITREVLQRGAIVNLVEFPAVAKNSCRWRLQVMADHTSSDVDRFTEIAAEARAVATVASVAT